MSIAGSCFYGDTLSNGYATSDSEMFQDCISVDTRSFVVSNGHAISELPEEDPKNHTESTESKSIHNHCFFHFEAEMRYVETPVSVTIAITGIFRSVTVIVTIVWDPMAFHYLYEENALA